MREILIKYCKGESLLIDEAILIIEEYMKDINKYDKNIIDHIMNPMNPFGRSMLETAIISSVKYLQCKYEINKLYSKEGQLLMVF